VYNRLHISHSTPGHVGIANVSGKPFVTLNQPSRRFSIAPKTQSISLRQLFGNNLPQTALGSCNQYIHNGFSDGMRAREPRPCIGLEAYINTPNMHFTIFETNKKSLRWGAIIYEIESEGR
jgi:hypothetical protein